MNRNSILTGPAIARASFDPIARPAFGTGRFLTGPGVFFEGERTKDPAAMSEAEFRGAVLGVSPT